MLGFALGGALMQTYAPHATSIGEVIRHYLDNRQEYRSGILGFGRSRAFANLGAMDVTIDPRFNGPSDSGHGGYVAGVVAGFLVGPARVRLHRPPPLGRRLDMRRSGSEVTLLDGEALVATGASTDVDLVVPDVVGFAVAEEASRAYPGFGEHMFRRCFGCGPARAAGDGLRIFAGPVPGRRLVAAPWIPDETLTDGGGAVRPEFLWAALDCPSGWAAIIDADGRPSVLGELAARLVDPVSPGERCVVLGWALGGEGRKRFAASAILGDGGAVRAVARSTWIAFSRD